MAKRILIIEDDPHIAELIELQLKDLSFEVESASNGSEGLDRACKGNFDLVVLDLMLPGLNGLDVCRELRSKNRHLPIIMLTVKSGLLDKILGLEYGADDYLTKPFSTDELKARIRALLRRSETRDAPPSRGVTQIGPLQVDFDRRKVTRGSEEIALTAKQFDLLAFLARSPGRAYTRADLLLHVWDYESTGYEHTVDTHINRLRGKIEPDPSNPSFILTVWGVGYRFAEHAEITAAAGQ
jgi:DNA-binding response OmpR family regulator